MSILLPHIPDKLRCTVQCMDNLRMFCTFDDTVVF